MTIQADIMQNYLNNQWKNYDCLMTFKNDQNIKITVQGDEKILKLAFM